MTLSLFGGAPVRTKPFPAWPIFDATDEARVLASLRTGKWGRLAGDQVETFEQRFAAMHGCGHGVAVVNGTVSLRIALIAAGLQAEDEVIVPAYTFLSTATAVVEANCVPVFVDVDLATFNICPRAVEAAITPRTKAIVPVHFAGQTADMEALLAIARRRGLFVLEDAAHAHGATWCGVPAGSIGHAASFSFQSSKNLTAGEGGIVVTNDEALAASCRSIHNCGRVPGGIWYEHHVISGNYRLSELQGALLGSQLDRLESQTATRDSNGRDLGRRLSAIPGVLPQGRLESTTRHSQHLFMLRLDPEVFGAPRAVVLEALQAEGIPCSSGYGYPLHEQPLFRNKAFGPYLAHVRDRLDYSQVRCPNSDVLCREQAVWLDQSMMLGTPADMDDIVTAFEKVHRGRQALLARSGQAG